MIKTVGELLVVLERFPAEMPIKALWDTVAVWSVHRVEVDDGVAIIDCGSDSDGDWRWVEKDRQRRQESKK